MAGRTTFLLSPANCGGERMGLVLRRGALFPLARQVQSPEGAPIGEVFTFASGLYFRGKQAYARRFGEGLVIAPGAGLVPLDRPISAAQLEAMARIPVDLTHRRYRHTLERAARNLAHRTRPRDRVVLLGSVASDKYTTVLLSVFGEGLLFPEAFVGRGDMSRGGLLLRCVRAGVELDYVPVLGARVHGERPPRLPRWRPDTADIPTRARG